MTHRSLLLSISRWALLGVLFFSPWVLAWMLTLPNLDAASVPNAANVPKLRPADLLAALSIGSYALAGWPQHRRLLAPGARAWSAALIALAIWAAASVAWAEHRELAVVFALRLALWVMLALRAACDPPSLPSMAGVMLAGVTVNAGVGVAQFLRQHALGLAWLGELPINLTSPNVSVVGGTETHLIRLYGLSGHPNVMGGYLAAGLLLGSSRLGRPGRWRRAARAGWLLGLVALLMTFSRSAWLGLLAGGVIMGARAVWRRPQPQIAVAPLAGIVAAVLIGFGMTFAPFLRERLMIDQAAVEETSLDQRVAQAEVAARLISAHPLTGVGAGNFSVAGGELAGAPVDWVHNVPLLVATELGLAGAGLWLLSTWLVLQRSMRLPSAIAATVAALLVVMMFDHYAWTSSQGVYVWAIISGRVLAGSDGHLQDPIGQLVDRA